MLIVMEQGISDEQVSKVVEKVESLGFKAHPIPGALRTAIGITGNSGPLDPALFEMLPGVIRAIPVTQPFKLVSREVKHEDTVIEIAGRVVGGGQFTVIAGPCAVESLEQTLSIARSVKKAGAHFLRGGAFKPRTSPYSFQGLGEEGLKILSRARQETGLPIVTEALDTDTVDLVAEYADVVQIGARNMQNFSLLKRVGRTRRPVLLKRGMSATIDELLMSAEYIAAEGNYQIILCERGVRTFSNHTRNTLDLSSVPAVKGMSHLPMFVDPSHGTGRRDKVAPLARAGVAVGADGVIIEVHDQPERALSDGPQALYPDQFEQLMTEIRAIAALVGRAV
ncbi:MAG TPA: 3-deoxy-7-phosphoheptulonate synthase [Candidatus Polarisedimenticolia bacterium]|nr:3-deoxy-7-phosphoheptulonate synthase [Candidatus Polarisedimenticolia bacterium]